MNGKTTLLRIDSSPLSNGSSFSRRLTEEFVSEWRNSHPDGDVITRDLGAAELSPVTAAWIQASYTPEPSRTADQKELLQRSDELIAELQKADEYVLGVPMHNFSIPSVLKLWIDQVARAGKTFSYEGGAPKGLLTGKKATLLIATGGVYEDGPAAAMNFVEPYLRSVLGFIGITDVRVIYASGTGQVRAGVDRETILKPALDSIRASVKAA